MAQLNCQSRSFATACSTHRFQHVADEASASPASNKDGQYYYGHFIPHKRPAGAGEKYLVNQKAKIRHQVRKSLAGNKLKEAGAPETAAAAPKGELPQDPKAAEHQKQYLERLQKVQASDAAAKARRENTSKDRASQNRKKEQKQQRQAPKAKAAKSTPQAKAAKSPSRSPSDASKTKASSGNRPVTVSSDPSAAKVSSGAKAAKSASDAKAAKASSDAAAATASSDATTANLSPDATASQRASDASVTEAAPDSARLSLDPVHARPGVQTASNSDWRLQQRQWQASHTPRVMPASAGIDLLQSPSSPPPPPPQNRKPGFKGRGPGRPHTPYAPFAPPPPQPEEESEPELSPEEQQQQEETIEAVVRCVAFQPALGSVSSKSYSHSGSLEQHAGFIW